MYERSQTELDRVSLVTPNSFLGRRRARGPVGAYLHPGGIHGFARRMAFAGLGQEAGVMPDMTATSLPTTGSTGFSWDSLISTVGQIYTTATQAELQKDLMNTNLTRAAQGLPPIPPSSVAPQVNVGISADTQKTILYVGLGAAAILGVAYMTGSIGHRRRR
ncbi:MAG: hypothetical protein ACREDH_12220 [Methylocella sp.]